MQKSALIEYQLLSEIDGNYNVKKIKVFHLSSLFKLVCECLHIDRTVQVQFFRKSVSMLTSFSAAWRLS